MHTPRKILLLISATCAFSSAFTNSSVTVDQAMDVLKIEAKKSSGTSPYCQISFIDQQEDRVTAEIQRAEFLSASSRASVQAGASAACAMKDPSQTNLSGWMERVGRMLALSAIAGKKSDLLTPETAASAMRAQVLLTYANQQGMRGAGEMLALLAENGFGVPAGANPGGNTEAVAALKASSKVVAEKYAENTFAFRQTYSGKVLEVTGPMRGVFDTSRGDKPSALVIVTGIPRANPDLVALRDEIECKVNDAESLQAAAKLQKKQQVTIKGLYEPKRVLPFESRVVLHECQIR